MLKKEVKLAILSIIIVLAGIVIMYNTGYSAQKTEDTSTLKYEAYVCIYKNGELIECSSNLLYDNGKNMTRDALGVGSTGRIRNISLCNATAGCGAPVAAGSEPFNSFTSCGLESVEGTYNTIGSTPGNWTITNTFTASCNGREVNSTRLTNVTGGIFAGNTFTLVTLQSSDQLTVNWTIMVTSG